MNPFIWQWIILISFLLLLRVFWYFTFYRKSLLHRGYIRYTIYLLNRKISFYGKYCRELETDNWHYYQDDKGRIYHFRKENIAGAYGDDIQIILQNRKEEECRL